MKAAIYPGDGQPIVIADLPDPRPAMGELLIRVHRWRSFARATRCPPIARGSK